MLFSSLFWKKIELNSNISICILWNRVGNDLIRPLLTFIFTFHKFLSNKTGQKFFFPNHNCWFFIPMLQLLIVQKLIEGQSHHNQKWVALALHYGFLVELVLDWVQCKGALWLSDCGVAHQSFQCRFAKGWLLHRLGTWWKEGFYIEEEKKGSLDLTWWLFPIELNFHISDGLFVFCM